MLLMKNVLLLVFISFFLISGCESSKDLVKPSEQVEVNIEQNGKLIKPSNGIITLNKKAFNIIITFPEPMAVLVNASFDDRLFRLASEGKQLTELPEFNKPNIVAVALKNPDRIIYMVEGSSSPWFYENEEEHNFNKIEILNNRYRCTRTVRRFSHEDSSENIEVKNIDQPIYLVFASSAMAEENPNDIIFHGKPLKIDWK